MKRPLPIITNDARLNGGHSGLWFDKFFDCYGRDWQKPDAKAKSRWIDVVAGGQVGDTDMLLGHCTRVTTLVGILDGKSRELALDWHLAVGLGAMHPLENGCVWHPTLGVPYIAASGVKGLLRAWLKHWSDDDVLPGKADKWLGTPDCGGSLIVFDAVPVKPVSLGEDVMTPHMGGWYAHGGDEDDELPEIMEEWQRRPADWHSPVPIPFLVVKSATFLFGIAPAPGRADAEDAKLALDALANALRDIGAGAKTAAGYGRFSSPTG